MLVGAWPALAGQVQLDGVPIGQWRAESRNIGYLPQEVKLFEGRLVENVARSGKPETCYLELRDTQAPTGWSRWTCTLWT